jgi:hypothetical protein
LKKFQVKLSLKFSVIIEKIVFELDIFIFGLQKFSKLRPSKATPPQKISKYCRQVQMDRWMYGKSSLEIDNRLEIGYQWQKCTYLKNRSASLKIYQKISISSLFYFFLLEIVIAVCHMPFFFADQLRMQATDIFGNDSFAINARKRLYALPDYRKMMETLMPVFLHKGFFD